VDIRGREMGSYCFCGGWDGDYTCFSTLSEWSTMTKDERGSVSGQEEDEIYRVGSDEGCQECVVTGGV
jgi:hypothetical protein